MRLFLVTCALLAGCAAPPEPAPPISGDALVVGKSTKADVRAALGEGTVASFDSGYEVWVYRERAAAELVLLFEPSGILSRKRVR